MWVGDALGKVRQPGEALLGVVGAVGQEALQVDLLLGGGTDAREDELGLLPVEFDPATDAHEVGLGQGLQKHLGGIPHPGRHGSASVAEVGREVA